MLDNLTGTTCMRLQLKLVRVSYIPLGSSSKEYPNRAHIPGGARYRGKIICFSIARLMSANRSLAMTTCT